MRFLIPFILVLGCSSEPPNYDASQLKEMAMKGDPNMKVKIPKNFSEQLVDCNDYTPPCRYGLIVTVHNVEMKPLYYDDQKEARKAAKRIKGYVVRNWVLDDVTGEPVLEKFVKKYLKASKLE